MIFIIAFSTFLSLAYVLLIYRLYLSLKGLSGSAGDSPSLPPVSIIVPFRNEEAKLPELLKQVETLDYPSNRFELVLVDDHSEDRSAEIAKDFLEQSVFSVNLLRLTDNYGKKAAIALAIAESQFDIIVQTDADGRFSRNWLRSMTHYLNDRTRVVVGAVHMVPGRGFWSGFAALEYMSLQAVTAAFAGINNPIMASGANLLYRKEVWDQTRIHSKRLSGDDTFLIQEAGKTGGIKFALDPDVQVRTDSPAGLKALLNQRARWGGKSTSYPSTGAKLLALFIAVLNIHILFLLAMAFGNSFYIFLWVGMITLKAMMDYLFLNRYAKLSSEQSLMSAFFSAALIYPFYIALTGMVILFGRSEWKGRRFRPVTD